MLQESSTEEPTRDWIEHRPKYPIFATCAEPSSMTTKRWAIGLVTGAIVGFGTLVGGVLVAVLGLVAILLLAWVPARNAAVGGHLTGFGTTWLLLFGSADLGCSADCVGPDLTPWLAAALILLVIGVILSIRAAGEARSGALPPSR